MNMKKLDKDNGRIRTYDMRPQGATRLPSDTIIISILCCKYST